MGAPLRSRLQMDKRRAQLIQHGLELFGTRDYGEISIDDIADRANVSKGLLYHYFGGKRAFYVEVVRHAARQLLSATMPDPGLSPALRGLSGVHGYLDFVEENATQYRALVTGGVSTDPELNTILENARMAFVGRIMLDIGLTEPRPVFRVALRGWISGVEAASLQWLNERDLPRETLVALLLLGVRSTLEAAVRLDPDAGVELDAFELPASSTQLSGR